MAKWSKNKVETDAINGGNEFVKGGNLALNELNAIVNNSFFASEKAESAEQKVNSFVEEKGRTAVTIEGQVQPSWSADFVEAEKSKSCNLWSHSGDIEGATGQTFITLDKPIEKGEYYITCDVSYTNTSDPLFATPIMAFYDENDNVFNSVGFRGGSIRQIILQKQALKVGFYVGSGSNPDYVYDNETYKFSNIMISTEKLSVYQAKRGAITHNDDAPVVFAEAERQKSKNLFNKYAITKGVELVSDTGEERTAELYWVSEYINIQGMSALYISGTRTSGTSFCYYSEDKTFISTQRLGEWVGQLTPPTNAVYLRFNGLLTELDDIQLEKGTVATDYQEWSGKTLHKEDIVGVEHIEVIYDKETGKTTLGGKDYGGGIQGGVRVDNLDLSKYKKLKIYVKFNLVYSSYLHDLAIPNSQGTCMLSNSATEIMCIKASTNGEKTVFEINEIGYFVTTFTSKNGNENYCVYKIEGVY